MTTAPEATGVVALAERIELWPIDRLRPYERNPRTHSEAQVDQIAASMVEFGWTNPILIDENAGILAGHGRLLAARKLGLAEVPVIRFEHLSEAQKGADVLADNQIALQAGWDDALLAEELAWLRDDLITHSEVTTAYERFLDGAFLRQGQARGSFEYAGIVFEEYRGRVGTVDFTDASKAYFFPVGVPGLFRQYNAPADFVETANTIGLPRYAKQAVDQQFARWVMLHVQSNPLPICTRPRVLIKGKRT
jgi:hypothetical protein